MSTYGKYCVVVSGLYGEMFTCYNPDRSEMAFDTYNEAETAKQKMETIHGRSYYVMHKSQIVYKAP